MSVQRLTITTMGQQTLVERLTDRIYGALYNLPLDSTDNRRAVAAAMAVICEGEFQDFPDHGSRHDAASHS